MHVIGDQLKLWTMGPGLHYEISSGPKTMYKLYIVYKIYYAECITYVIIQVLLTTQRSRAVFLLCSNFTGKLQDTSKKSTWYQDAFKRATISRLDRVEPVIFTDGSSNEKECDHNPSLCKTTLAGQDGVYHAVRYVLRITRRV